MDNFVLSDLPESIFHQILSFLDTKDVVRVSTLSRRYRELCFSSPFLNIVVKKFHDGDEFSRFREFLNQFMVLHFGNNNNNTHKVKVDICCENLDIDVGNVIGSWVREAITRFNVEKICLVLDEINIFSLTSDVLDSESLRELEVNLGPDGYLILPTITSFGGLVNLTLKHMRVSIKSFGKWISSCKTLKMLHLDDVDGMDKLKITSSSLEDLVLENINEFSGDDFNIKVSAGRLIYLRIAWTNGDPGDYPIHSLTLHSPNLQKLSWGGCVSHYSFEGNFQYLWYSDISILSSPYFCNEDRALANRIIAKAIQTVYQVSSICITDYCVKEISSLELLPEFCNLRSLTLIRTGLGNEIMSKVSLLNSMPHLNALKIGLKPFGFQNFSHVKTCYNADYWESQNLEFVHSLMEVELEINGEQDEIELIKYLLKNAKSLKKMTVRYSSQGLHRQSVISRMIQQFQIASPSICINFVSK